MLRDQIFVTNIADYIIRVNKVELLKQVLLHTNSVFSSEDPKSRLINCDIVKMKVMKTIVVVKIKVMPFIL